MITFDRGLISKMIVRYFTKKKRGKEIWEISVNLNALSVIKTKKKEKKKHKSMVEPTRG